MNQDKRRAGAMGMAGGRSEDDFLAQRHPGDVVRVALGVVAVAASAFAARRHRPASAETDIFRLVNHLPEVFALPLRVLMQARDLGVAGTSAWLMAKAMKLAVNRQRPEGLLESVTVRGVEAHDLGFPSSHAAIAAALAAAAAPHFGPRTRRLLWVGAFTVAFARVYVGVHLPADVLGGMALGWVAGSGVHLVWGRPGDPGMATLLRDALARHGIEAVEVVPLTADARRSSPFW